MRKRIVGYVASLLILGGACIVWAQTTQAPVVVTVTISAADATALKASLLAPGGGTGSELIDLVDGVRVVTDANVRAWAQQRVQSELDAIMRSQAEAALRESQADLNTLTAAQRAQVVALIKSLKKK